MTTDDNPFERWDLDPGDDRQELTDAMRKKSRNVDPDERNELQRHWRLLTTDPVARARWALLTPPKHSGESDAWSEAETLIETRPGGQLPVLEPTIEDALVLPLLIQSMPRQRPPFLPEQRTDDDRSREDQ